MTALDALKELKRMRAKVATDGRDLFVSLPPGAVISPRLRAAVPALTKDLVALVRAGYVEEGMRFRLPSDKAAADPASWCRRWRDV